MAKRKTTAPANTEDTFDSGFFSAETEPPKPKRRAKVPAPKQSVEVTTNEHRLATPAQGGNSWKTRSPSPDPAYDKSRNEQLHSPSLRLSKRADHDIRARLDTRAESPTVRRGPTTIERPSSVQDAVPLNRGFLSEYKQARLGSEDGVPSREEIVRLLAKYPSVNDQPIVTTLLQDIVDLKADVEQVRKRNQALRREMCILMEMAEEI